MKDLKEKQREVKTCEVCDSKFLGLKDQVICSLCKQNNKIKKEDE